MTEEIKPRPIDPHIETDWAGTWLAAVAGIWGDLEAAVLRLPPTPGGTSRTLRWPDESHASPALLTAVTQCANQQEPEIREISRARSRGFLVSLPLCGATGDPVLAGGALTLHVRHARQVEPAAERKHVLAQAQALLSTLTPGLRERMARERLSLALEVLACSLEWEACGAASLAVVTQLALRLSCDRVTLVFRPHDTPKIEAVSHNARVDRRSRWASTVRAAVSEAFDQETTVCVPAPSGHLCQANLAHLRLCEEVSARSVWTVPFAGSGRAVGIVGALCFESATRAPRPETIELCEDIAALVGPALDLRRRERDSLGGRWSALSRQIRERPGRRNFLAVVALGLTIFALTSGDFRIDARAKLQGRVVRAVAAGIDGYVSEAHVRAGDTVRKGSLLARLDDRDLQIEHRNWTGKLTQLEREYRGALAQHDRSRSAVVDAQLSQARAEFDLTVARLARTQLVAPFDAVVMEGDWSQKLGAPVERGDVLFELAPLDGYRIVLEVDERDISHVALGQAGQLALTALPGEPLPLVVRRIIPIAAAEDGRTFFRVEADLDAPGARLRPGMDGVAKLDAGRRQRIQMWARPIVDSLRLWLWRWWV